jgi:hypothetical protein
MTDHAHELRRHARKIAHPAGDVPAVMRAAADEIERLQNVIAGLRAELKAAHAMALNGVELKELAQKYEAEISAMKRQAPVATVRINAINGNPSVDFVPGHRYLHHNDKLYLAPGAQPAPVDDSATIAGLESAVTHLSVLLDSFRALLVEVNDVCGRDGHGGQLEDGESEIIDKVRAAISMTEAPPCAKGEEK